MSEPIPYIFDIRFCNSRFVTKILNRHISIAPGSTLSPEEEWIMFFRMHLARYHLSQMLRETDNVKHIQKQEALHLYHTYRRQIKERNKIAIGNLNLVYAIAKRRNFLYSELSDLIAEGNLALIRAIESFDWTRGYKFSTFAYTVISSDMKRLYFKQSKYYKQHQLCSVDSLESYDFVNTYGEEKEYDMLYEIQNVWKNNLAHLSAMEKSVIEKRFNLHKNNQKPPTLSMVGKQFGLSYERIRQLECKALLKIKEAVQNKLQH
jgi:RNA polymerase sigma factor (sigma-70 family)